MTYDLIVRGGTVVDGTGAPKSAVSTARPSARWTPTG
jgi:N-acyl-D-aspartate/D-glutamate deacylase